MRQRKTPTSNGLFELLGGNEDNYLYVERTSDEDGAPVLLSVWDLDKQERKQIARGGTLELLVWGEGTPPVALRVGPSMQEREQAEEAGQ